MPTFRQRPAGRRWLRTLFLHMRPQRVPQRQLALTFTWGLGGMAAVSILLSMVSGLLLKFAYLPFPDGAYASVLRIQNEIAFGGLIRNVHHWSANLLILLVLLHLLRVFFSGAFYGTRRINWVIGLLLLAMVLLANFTGYLLPWDQLAYWAVTICIGMLEYIPAVGSGLQQIIAGGAEVGPQTLSNFYAFHTALLPVGLLTLMAYHFWRIRKARGLVLPRQADESNVNREPLVPTIPHLLVREMVAAVVLVAVVCWMGLLFDTPLHDQANPGLSPNPTKAPWYFAGLQELLLLFHPLFAVCIIPIVVAAGLFVFPYLTYPWEPAGIWFVSVPARRSAVFSALLTVVLTVSMVALREKIATDGWIPVGPSWIANGLLPAGLWFGILIGWCAWLKRGRRVDRNELVQVFFVFGLVSLLVLTVIGIWFRGAGMVLTPPW